MKTTIRSPRCPVMSNVTAQPHTGPDDIRRLLVDQLTHPVRWAQCCEHLTARHPGAEFHELAPGKSLAGMMRRIAKDTKVITHDEPG
jgi:[acyl-carrier-protein] S-malonyltransferase